MIQSQNRRGFRRIRDTFKQVGDLKDVDGLVISVAHRAYAEMGLQKLLKPLRSQQEGVVIDVKCLLDQMKLPKTLKYWRL
jgi:hypothetical protein